MLDTLQAFADAWNRHDIDCVFEASVPTPVGTIRRPVK